MTAYTRLFLTALLLAAVSACGPIAGKVPAGPVMDEGSMTSGARTTYHYLVYQDQLARMQELSQTPNPTEQTVEDILRSQAAAAQAMDALIAEDPTPTLYAEKANLYWNSRQILKARDIVKDGLKLFPDDRVLNLSLAGSYLFEDRKEAAATTLEDYLGRNPEDYDARERLARVLIDAQEFARAVDVLGPIPAQDRTADAYFLLGMAEGRLGKHKQAIIHLKKAVDMDPEFMEAWAELGYQYEVERDYARAEETYSRLLDMGDDRDEVRLRVIGLNLKLNDPQKALNTAITGPIGKSFVLDAVSLFLREGFPEKGEYVLDVLSSRNPVPPEYHFYKAVIAYDYKKDTDAALEHLSNIPDDAPGFARALTFRIELLFAKERDSEGLDLIRKGREAYPGSTEFDRLEARWLNTQGREAEAREVLEKALAAHPNDADLLYIYGQTLQYLELEEQALEAMERVIKINPDHPEALNFIGYLLADEERDLDRARVLISRALELDPESPFILDSMGWVLYHQGQYEQAAQYIRKALDRMGDDDTLWVHYGDIMAAMGKKAEARKAYQKALTLDPDNPESIRQKLDKL